jgi:hypothetical protein
MTNETNASARDALEARIEAMESGYEFMLAYAAQGRRTDRDAGGTHGVRTHLEKMARALDGLAGVARACADEQAPGQAREAAEFFAAIETDAARARAIVKLVLGQSDISSQLVDNLNASIHVRALLTDLFIVDEALKPKRE